MNEEIIIEDVRNIKSIMKTLKISNLGLIDWKTVVSDLPDKVSPDTTLECLLM